MTHNTGDQKFLVFFVVQVLETNFIVLIQSQDIEHNLQNSVICNFIVPSRLLLWIST